MHPAATPSAAFEACLFADGILSGAPSSYLFGCVYGVPSGCSWRYLLFVRCATAVRICLGVWRASAL
jgi:hypothetical protein